MMERGGVRLLATVEVNYVHISNCRGADSVSWGPQTRLLGYATCSMLGIQERDGGLSTFPREVTANLLTTLGLMGMFACACVGGWVGVRA